MYLSEVPFVWQTKSPKQIFSNNPQIECFHFICPTFLLSIWSCKKDVLYFSWFQTRWKDSKYGLFLVCIFLYVNWLQENTENKKLRIATLCAQWSVGFFREDFVTEDFFGYSLETHLFICFIYTLFNVVDTFIKYKLKYSSLLNSFWCFQYGGMGSEK